MFFSGIFLWQEVGGYDLGIAPPSTEREGFCCISHFPVLSLFIWSMSHLCPLLWIHLSAHFLPKFFTPFTAKGKKNATAKKPFLTIVTSTDPCHFSHPAWGSVPVCPRGSESPWLCRPALPSGARAATGFPGSDVISCYNTQQCATACFAVCFLTFPRSHLLTWWLISFHSSFLHESGIRSAQQEGETTGGFRMSDT